MSYDRWKTRAPDMDGPEELSQEQQQADFEDEMQQKMTRDQIDAIPRVEARQLLARVPAGPRYDDRVLLAVEQAMNLEWWRGYHAPKTIELADAGKLHDKLIRSYLLTINKGGPTESDLSAEEVDLILLALTRLAAPSPS